MRTGERGTDDKHNLLHLKYDSSFLNPQRKIQVSNTNFLKNSNLTIYESYLIYKIKILIFDDGAV